MSKNIVILFDGTSNEISADRTNILRLFGCLKRSDEQIVYYDPGVGTFGAANSWSRFYRKAFEVWGLATGWGLDQNVKEAYRFLVENYERGPKNVDGRHADRDRIYIFGFSRGAYSARVLAGFIHAFGLTTKYHLNLLDYAYKTYKGIPEQEQRKEDAVGDKDASSAFASMRLYERMLRNDRPPIALLGLFDTVASVIESGKWRPQLKTHPFTRKNPSVECVRHAVAIDERRTMFQPELWMPDQDYWGGPFKPKTEVAKQNFKEVWFSGVHGDIGGGYPEAESGQIKLPLDWMIRETGSTGLIYVTRTINNIVLGKNANKYVPLDPKADLHNSMSKGWKILEYVPRRVPESSWRRRGGRSGIYLPLEDRRFVPDGAKLHDSVKTRLDAGSYDPPNLPKDPNFVS
ncbi:T6SS phospholipase effector Tle1-like catalytic domain-containing protein [Neorhizobium tomejilense]|uniref:T6SS phospholipase effector Tle1-like catalytic domain-containing protein n=1 Tax=Neorhizobium tomejilense TaxID=2093828 RepID=UPI003ECC1D61